MAEGDIGAIINSLVFDATYCSGPSIVHIGGSTYAIAYRGTAQTGWVCTVSIADDGTLPDTIIDSFEFYTAAIETPQIIYIAGAVYAIVFMGVGTDGWLVTISIGGDGAITDPRLHQFEFDPGQGRFPAIAHVAEDVYAIAYQGVNTHGWIKTVEISPLGVITDPVLDTYEHDNLNCSTHSIIRVSGNTFAIAYSGPDDDGWLHTVEIADNGTITTPFLGAFEFNITDVQEPKIFHIAGEVFAITYTDAGNAGWITTVRIADDGTITTPVLDRYNYDAAAGQFAEPIRVSGNLYAIAYSGTLSDGWLVTVTIADDGTITAAIHDSLEFDESYGVDPDIIHVSGNVYAVAYRSDVGPGVLITVDMETVIAGEGTPTHMMMGIV